MAILYVGIAVTCMCVRVVCVWVEGAIIWAWLLCIIMGVATVHVHCH